MPASDHLRILAFEPFDAGSHRAVREAVCKHSRHHWTWITRPGRNWKWRMRLAAAEMLDDLTAMESAAGWNAVFVTSLMSAADLRALLPAPLRHLPLILYMHENQAAYPAGAETDESRSRDAHFMLTNLTSVLAADRVLWNSAWNKQSFIDGIEQLLRKGSDLRLRDVRERIEKKSAIIWPPVDVPAAWFDQPQRADDCDMRDGKPIRVAWPHRWEHDKGPDELLALADRWTQPLNLRWTILGERYENTPSAMAEFKKRFASRIDHMGYLPDREAYLAKLCECDWVLSTARHEFFGIAVVEAMLAGCLPWLPSHLSYPELLPQPARDISPMNPPADASLVRKALREHLRPAHAPEAVKRLDETIQAECAASQCD